MDDTDRGLGSMDTIATIKPGEVQRMSAGTGVEHSEFNHLKDRETHILQIWIFPEADGLKPGYEQKDFSKQLASGEMFLAASHDGRDGSVKMNQDAKLYAAKPKSGAKFDLPITKSRKGWLQLITGLLTVGDKKISTGDGLAIANEDKVTVQVGADAHFLFFDLPG